MPSLTEQQKVRRLYNLIGQRGLYVNTSFDVFTEPPETVALAGGSGYSIPLANPGSHTFSSPLLFATLTSLMRHGTMLLTGAPGLGKTTGAEFAGHFFTGTPLDEIIAAEIPGHPQLTEEKMIAHFDIPKLLGPEGKEEVLPRAFLTCPVKIIDEVNRIPPDTLSIAMRLVDTGTATYGNQILTATPGPLFVTANYADEGTFKLTPPFLDRFDVAVMVSSPQMADLDIIRKRGDEKLNGDLKKLLELPEELALDHERIRKEIKAIPEETEYGISLASSFTDFLYSQLRFCEGASPTLVRGTKGNAWQVSPEHMSSGHFVDGSHLYTTNEASVRTMKAIPRIARAYAWFTGKDSVGLEEVKTVLPYLLWHKLQPSQKASTDFGEQTANDRIAFTQAVLHKVEEEYTELRGDAALETYGAALNALRTGKVGKRALTLDDKKTLARNAIERIGQVDKPYALNLAQHVAAEYHHSINGE